MTSFVSPHLITLADIETVLQGDLRPAQKDRILPAVGFDNHRQSKWEGNAYKIYTDAERKALLLSKCHELKQSIHDPQGHRSRIDQALSALFTCNFVLKESETVTMISEKVYKLLTRLPSRPLSLLDFPPDLSPEYFTALPPNDDENGHCHLSWANLQVVSFLGTSIIRMALTYALYGPQMVWLYFQEPINAIADMLAMCSAVENEAANKVDHHRWFIVRAFLWSFWQRALMIYFHSSLASHLILGFNHGRNQEHLLVDTTPSPGWSAHYMSRKIASQGKAKYMCSWAFELLRTEPVSIGMDFRHFHERYSQLHGHLDARCNRGSTEPCNGTHSDHCQRFKGMKVVDQSAHDGLCEGDCPKLRWDESSYRAVSDGARAVSLTETEDVEERLKYCKASDKTVAISHVWCHGQGGRPEDGINRCLHQRYNRIARGMGCDSYWMDAPCIPEDHQLRDEAIRQINDVFSSSHITLVCDRDMMQIDSTELSLELMEAIIATVLVCDWNARAWTFLEAMRGRQHIHILCKNDRTVSFSEILQAVHDRGRIDLVIFCLLAPHLLPWYSANVRSKSTVKIELATTATMLTYRPASRKGDEVVIWSLVSSDKPCYTAEALWRSRVGIAIQTGFLVSSSPRLGIKGLSWAPATPYAAPSSQDLVRGSVFHRPFDGIDTELAIIEKQGLVGQWFVSEFPGQRLNTNSANHKSKVQESSARGLDEFNKIRCQFLQHYRFGLLLQPISASTSHRHLDSEPVAPYRGRISGTLLVVCGSNKVHKRFWKEESIRWHWRGVYEWPREIPLPTFDTREILLT